MIILGLILVVCGKVFDIDVLFKIGLVLLIIGVLLLVCGVSGVWGPRTGWY